MVARLLRLDEAVAVDFAEKALKGDGNVPGDRLAESERSNAFCTQLRALVEKHGPHLVSVFMRDLGEAPGPGCQWERVSSPLGLVDSRCQRYREGNLKLPLTRAEKCHRADCAPGQTDQGEPIAWEHEQRQRAIEEQREARATRAERRKQAEAERRAGVLRDLQASLRSRAQACGVSLDLVSEFEAEHDLLALDEDSPGSVYRMFDAWAARPRQAQLLPAE